MHEGSVDPEEFLWKGGRVVEGAGLENRYGSNAIVGSNPTSSAKFWRDGRVVEGDGLENR